MGAMVMITQEYLKQCVTYNRQTGLFFWKERPSHHFGRHQDSITWNKKFSGNKAGCYRGGYLCFAINNKLYQSHRLAWLYCKGSMPTKDIDHINGIKTDNRINNLRDVTNSENHRNTKLHSSNKTGMSGVSIHKPTGSYRAYISVNSSHVHLGLFKHIFDAFCARKSAENKYGYHINHGRLASESEAEQVAIQMSGMG